MENQEHIIIRLMLHGVKHVALPEEAFRALWKLAKGTPEDPLSGQTVNFFRYPMESS